MGLLFDEKVRFKDLESKVERLVQSRKPFQVVGLKNDNFNQAIKIVEEAIEKQGLKCRVLSKGRDYDVAAMEDLFPTAAIAVLAFNVAHNLLTLNPDYEVAKKRGWFSHKLYVKSVVKK